MKLAEKVLDNERNKKAAENKQLIRARLKEVVYAFPKPTLEVLQKTGVQVSPNLPAPVVYAIVVKNLAKNSKLREAIAKMILEADGYASADGVVWQTIGGAISAVGSVLTGIGRGQAQSQPDTDAEKQVAAMQQQLDNERAQKSRQMWITIGISAVVLIAVVVGIIAFMKSKPAAKSVGKPSSSVTTIPQT